MGVSVAAKKSSSPIATGAEVTVAPKLIAVSDSMERLSRPSSWSRRLTLRRGDLDARNAASVAETWMITPRGNRVGSRRGETPHPSRSSAGSSGFRCHRDPGFRGRRGQSGDFDPATEDTPPGLAPSGEDRRRRHCAGARPPGRGLLFPIDVRPRDRTERLLRARRCRRGRLRRVAITRQKATSVSIVAVEVPSRAMVRNPDDAEPCHEDWKAAICPRALSTPRGRHRHIASLLDRHESPARVPRAMSSIFNEK